ncbi:YfiT family bacillithiol transferase [Paenibacillus sp. MMS18-CY102]|uniref:YfiT family bacillithiol transferase n=1 Tax=Paenibacillus sp. MMS18-CY102 TaxID=2682849 RepID=UPI00136581DF|nr:putative metal-dependent hydrolase [Paenibacillus sp. MMS18-CY102]MWC27574.1 putative metal-dependent hydrolase [Paenibacillus sp. MMS18-CY102]
MSHSIRFPIGSFTPLLEVTDEARAGYIRQLSEVHVSLQKLVSQLREDQLSVPYRPGGWNIKQIIHHMADNDMNAYLRFKRGLTEETPMGSSYEQDRFAEMADYRDIPIAHSIQLLELLHARLVILLQKLEPETFARKITTAALGEITLDIALQRFVWHNQHHIGHIASLVKDKGW